MSLPFLSQLALRLIKPNSKYFDNNTLIVSAPGIGTNSLISRLIGFYSKPRQLIFVIGDPQMLEEALNLVNSSVHNFATQSFIHPIYLTSKFPSQQRITLYSRGGVFFIPPRILIVDILCDIIPLEKLVSILVLDAHHVKQNSSLAFILQTLVHKFHTLFPDTNWPLIHSFTQRPTSVSSRGSHLMSLLWASRIELWPRFRKEVKESFSNKDNFILSKVSIQMTSLMKMGQEACLSIIHSLLQELCKIIDPGSFGSSDTLNNMNPNEPVDHQAEVPENPFDIPGGIQSSIEIAKENQLNNLSTLSSGLLSRTNTRTKTGNGTETETEIGANIGGFHNTKNTSHPDADVHFHQKPPKLGTKTPLDSNASQFPFTEMLHVSNRKSSDPATFSNLRLKNSENFNIFHLSQIALPNYHYRLKSHLSNIWHTIGSFAHNLIFDINQFVTLLQLLDRTDCVSWCTGIETTIRSAVKNSSGQLSSSLHDKSLSLPTFTKSRYKQSSNYRFSALTWMSHPSLDTLVSVAQNRIYSSATVPFLEVPPKISVLFDIIQKHKESTIVCILDDTTTKYHVSDMLISLNKTHLLPHSQEELSDWSNHHPHLIKKYRRYYDIKVALQHKRNIKRLYVNKANTNGTDNSSSMNNVDVDIGIPRPPDPADIQSLSPDPLPPLSLCLACDVEAMLELISPQIIILYSPNLIVIRNVELYATTKAKANHSSNITSGIILPKTRIYLLSYENSLASARFRAEIRQEKKSFLTLASTFAHRPHIVLDPSTRPDPISDQNNIIVDMREFRSKLPALLYSMGFTIIPKTLTVGDYILTPQVGIERKSIPDLMGSFNSGRLVEQLRQLSHYYRFPALLIEFATNSYFGFPTFGTSSHINASGTFGSGRGRSFSRINSNSANLPSTFTKPENPVFAKLAKTVLTFPKVRILWSVNPQASVSLCARIKYKRNDPSVDVSVEKGLMTDEMLPSEWKFSNAAASMIILIPGVSIGKRTLLAKTFKSILELSQASESAIRIALNDDSFSSRRIFNFIHGIN